MIDLVETSKQRRLKSGKTSIAVTLRHIPMNYARVLNDMSIVFRTEVQVVAYASCKKN